MNISTAIKYLKKKVLYPSKGLPDDLFYYVSSITPMINVDLLIKNNNGHTLLAWRDDQYAGKGWHIPGGIIRYKESINERINEVAKNEIGAFINFYHPEPIAINEIFNYETETRNHFISLLYKCSLPTTFVIKNKVLSKSDSGYLMWHNSCPNNLLKLQDIYRKYI